MLALLRAARCAFIAAASVAIADVFNRDGTEVLRFSPLVLDEPASTGTERHRNFVF